MLNSIQLREMEAKDLIELGIRRGIADVLVRDLRKWKRIVLRAQFQGLAHRKSVHYGPQTC